VEDLRLDGCGITCEGVQKLAHELIESGKKVIPIRV